MIIKYVHCRSKIEVTCTALWNYDVIIAEYDVISHIMKKSTSGKMAEKNQTEVEIEKIVKKKIMTYEEYMTKYRRRKYRRRRRRGGILCCE